MPIFYENKKARTVNELNLFRKKFMKLQRTLQTFVYFVKEIKSTIRDLYYNTMTTRNGVRCQNHNFSIGQILVIEKSSFIILS